VSVVVVPEAKHQFDLQEQGLIEVLDYCPDGSSVVGLSSDDRGWLVLLENRGARIDLGPFGDEVTRKVAFSADGQRVIAAGDDEVAVLYSTGDGNELARFTPASDVKFSPAGTYVIEIAESGEARLWDAQDATVIMRWSLKSPAGQALFSADDSLLATTGAEEGDDDVQLWKTGSGELYATLHHPGRIIEMIFSNDGKQLITAVEDGQTYLWLTKSAKLRAKISSAQTTRDLIINEDGTRLLVFDERRAWLWSTRGRRKMVDSSLGNDIIGARFSPDGNWLAVTHENGVIRLWDAKRGDEIGAFDHGTTFQLAFSPNSRRLVTLATEPYVLRLWDLQTVRDGFDPLTHFESTAAAISTDGSWFCYADGNLLRLWSTDEKRQISVLYNDRSHGQIEQMRGITQGKYLYVASQHDKESDSTETIHIWNAEHVPDVWRLVNERRLITSEHHVAGPTYTDVYIETRIALSQPTKTMTRLWQENVIHALYEFFHPLRGGPDGGGWPFGRDVYASEIYQILEGIDGVDYVESLTMGIQPDTGAAVEQGGPRLISVPPFHLVHLVVNPDAITFTE
jgi:WD40 repeat protein